MMRARGLIYSAWFSLVLSGCSGNQTTQDVQKMLDENLPIGTSRTAAERFLGENHIEYSWNPKARELRAIVQNVSGSAFVKKSVAITFVVDADDKLQRYQLKEQFTGP